MSTGGASAPRRPALTFRYQPGSMHARFYHSTCDYIEMDLRMGGDTTWVQEVEPGSCEPLSPERRVAEASVEHTVYFSSVFCAFPSFIRFLEAITIGVDECGFTWDPEGPYGHMEWRSHGWDEGSFRLEWSSRGQKIDQSTLIRTYDAVEALYSAFRTFVESPAYEPFRYERMREWDAYSLVLSDAALGEFARAIAKLPAKEAEAVLHRAWSIASARRNGLTLDQPRNRSLEWFLLGRDDPIEELLALPRAWNAWTKKWRLRHLGRQWSRELDGWYGSNLRRLRSERIEAWLAGKRPRG
jgi:hypothetical protein